MNKIYTAFMNVPFLRFCSLSYVVFVLVLAACKDDDKDPTPEDIQTKKLTGTWSVGSAGSVMHDHVSLDGWDDFTLTIANRTYTTISPNEVIWPSSGTWRLAQDDLNTIERHDGVSINVNVSDTILILTFVINESSSGGRLKGISGEYKFTLLRQ